MPSSLKREPDAPPADDRPRRNLAFPLALGAVLVAALVLGIVLGGGGGDEAPDTPARSAEPTQPVAAGDVQVGVPADFRELGAPPALPGLELADPAGYAPGGRDGGRAVLLGMGDANDSTLLPPEFRGALGLAAGEVPERTAVQLGEDGLQAYRYEGLQPEGGDRRVTVYVAPTSGGVATVACLAPPADAGAFKPECDGIANTLRLGGGATPFPVGPDPAYAKLLGRTFSTLNRDVARGERALGRDGATFRAQSAAARGIQQAHAGAARRLKGADVGPADRAINAALAARLGAVAAAWKQAAAEAADKDKRGFARSERAIRRSQQQLAQTLAGLKAAGYTIAG